MNWVNRMRWIAALATAADVHKGAANGQLFPIPRGRCACASALEELHRRTRGLDRDFTVFSANRRTDSQALTRAPTPPLADVDGDGAVEMRDFGYIRLNFLAFGEAACCGLVRAAGSAPRTSISAAELEQLGLGGNARADSNQDGVVDLADAEALLNGQGPGLAPSKSPGAVSPTRGRGRLPGDGY